MKFRHLFAALTAVTLSQPANVWAQAWLSDSRLTEGTGVRAGSFELHPGIAGEFGYDSNYFQRAKSEDVIDAYRLRITPSLSFASYGKREAVEGTAGAGEPTLPAVVLRGKVSASYNALFPASSGHSSEVTNQSHLAGTVGLGADILPGRTWGGDVEADATRVVEASNDAETANAFRRDVIRAGAGVVWRPGGGLFKWRLGYGFTGNLFEDSAYQGLNNFRHRAETSGDWVFLPRTALVYRGEVEWVDFSRSPAGLNNGAVARSQLGINGLITNYFGVLAMGGWGASFYKGDRGPAENFDGFIGQAEVTWYPTPQNVLPQGGAPVGLSSVSLGFTRNFNTGYLGNYYSRNRGYLSATYFFGQRFVAAASGGLSSIYRPTSSTPVYAGGSETRADAMAFLEYRPGEAVGINATLRYDAELTNVVITGDDLRFSRYQAYLGLRWFL